MDIVLTLVLLGNLQVTSYRSTPQQTDSSPFHTSTGERVCGDGVAVSQDLLLSGRVKYGDYVYIENIGIKRVNDVMNLRHRNRMDVWVPDYKSEKEFDRKFGHRKLKVYLLKERQQ